MIPPPFDRVEVDPDAAELPFTRSFLDRIPPGVPARVRAPSDPSPEGRGTVHVTREPGAFLRPCPCSPGSLRCGYWVLSPALQCPFSCTYCFLRMYAPDAPLTLYGNLEDAAEEVHRVSSHWDGMRRVGTGQFADSLALDPWTGHARWLLDLIEPLPNVQLELKTKSDRVGGLLERQPPVNAVIGFSVNPVHRIETDEAGSAPLPARLGAAREVARAGYRVAIHFDPIVVEPGWRERYAALAGEVFEAVAPDRIEWVSLGSLRFPPRFLERWGASLRGNPAFFGEMLPGGDGKLRYFWPLRRTVYRALHRELRKRAGPRLRVYLCMEPPAMWSSALGWAPDEAELERYLTAAGIAKGPPAGSPLPKGEQDHERAPLVGAGADLDAPPVDLRDPPADG